MFSFRPLLLVLCLRPSLGWRSYDMDFTDFSCEIVDPTIVKIADLRLVPYNRHHALTGVFIFKKDVKEFEIEGKLTIMQPRQQPVEMVNTLLDGCATIESHFGPKTHVITKWVMREVRAMNGSFPARCPILKSEKIVFNNFFVDPERLPPYLPDLDYCMQIHVRIGGRRYVYKSFLNGTIVTNRGGNRPKKNMLPRRTSTG